MDNFKAFGNSLRYVTVELCPSLPGRTSYFVVHDDAWELLLTS
jgi:hypothetical protein